MEQVPQDSVITAGNLSNINEIKNNCEKIINQTQAELELFRHEQNHLRERIYENLEENKRLNLKLDSLKNSNIVSNESKDDATREKLQIEVYKNVKKQNDFLQSENHELRLLSESSQKTIANLENEIQNYRNQLFRPNSVGEVKQKYTTAIKLLECTIQKQKIEIEKQTRIIEDLISTKAQFRDRIERFEKILNEKEREIKGKDKKITLTEKLEHQLKEQMQQNKELEKTIKMTKRALEEQVERERCAIEKVQEALAIADSAVTDKEEAQRREKLVKEECDNLATTIGQVMDEAARKVEKDMAAMRFKYDERDKLQMDVQKQLKEEILNLKKYNQILEKRAACLDEQLQEKFNMNSKLVKELDRVTAKLVHLEKNVNNTNAMDPKSKKRVNEIERDIQFAMQANRELKEKFRATIDDMTKQFEKEIYKLQNENADLKAEIKIIRMNNLIDYSSE